MSGDSSHLRQKREAALRSRLGRISDENKVRPREEAIQSLADHAMDRLQQEKMKLDTRRRVRLPFLRTSTTLQKFVSALSQFMKAYSGLNEIAKGVDSQYGGLVAGALSILLQIGENKEGREMVITSTFADLQSWIGDDGRLSLYSDAYPTSSKMKGFLAEVYLGIGELAVESIEYFMRPPYSRFWQAIRRPPKLGIDLKADEIKKSIHDVVSEGNALLVHTVARQNTILEKKWAQERDDHISCIAQQLGISCELADPGKMITQCKELHANAFSQSVRKKGATKQLQQISIGLLKDLHIYERSGKMTESSVLVLSGKNFDPYETGRFLCWLSPVTTEFAEMYRSTETSERKCRVLFHSACSNEASRFSNRKEPFDICLSRFIIQILMWDEEYFSQNRQNIEYDIKNSDHPKAQTLQNLLRGWHGSDEVCVIIDRLDHIAPDCDRGSDEDDVSDLLETILEIVSTASCKIRLVVTVDASGWPQVRKDADMEARWNVWRRRIDLQRFTPFFRIDWQQPEVTKW